MGILKGIIKEKNLLVYEVAKRLDVSPLTLTHWDKGVTSPTVRQFAKLSEVLGEDFNELRKRIYVDKK